MWESCELYNLCKLKNDHMSSLSTEGRGALFVQSTSETSPRKVYLIYAFSSPLIDVGKYVEICAAV